MSGLQLMILPTGEAMRNNRAVFAAMHKEGGLPLMIVAHFLIEQLAVGDAVTLRKGELLDGFHNWLIDNKFMTDQLLHFLMRREGFVDAFYALYLSMQHLQELMMTAPRDRPGFLSGLAYHGWNGDDLVVSREITSINNNYAIAKWG